MSDIDNLNEAMDEAFDEAYGDVPKKKKKKKRLHEGVDPTSLPAGHARDETLKAIADELEQEADERATDEERFRLDPSKFVIENEIASKAGALDDISGAQPHRVYFWARYKAEHGSSQVDHKLSITIGVREIATGKTWKEQVWHVVKGDDPECLEMRQADGTRRIGDVILLWAKKEAYEAIVRVADQKRRELLGAPARAAQAFEAKTGIKIVTEQQMANDPRFEKIAKHAEGYREANLREQAQVRQQLIEQQRHGGR